jgi:hypothetical protein
MTPQQWQKVHDKELKQLEKLLCKLCGVGLITKKGERWCHFCITQMNDEFGLAVRKLI